MQKPMQHMGRRYSNYAVLRALAHITISAFVRCSSFGALSVSTDVVVATAVARPPLLAALVRVVENEEGTPPTSDTRTVVN